MKKRAAVGLFLACWGLRFTVFTAPVRNRRVRNEQSLHATVRKQRVAVVYITTSMRSRTALCTLASHNTLFKSFSSLAASGYYPKSAVSFVQIDACRAPDKSFLQDYGLTDVSMPSIVLFSNGVLVEDQHGPLVITGAVQRRELKHLIDDYTSLDTAECVQAERSCARYEKIMRNRMHLYYSPYFSSVANPWNGYLGWPYYGMAQGNYGGNAGVVLGNGGVSLFGSNY